MARLDKRGRKVGRNWWREMNMELFTLSTLVWEAEQERVGLGYDTEKREYERDNPRPTLKHLLVNNKGFNQRSDS